MSIVRGKFKCECLPTQLESCPFAEEIIALARRDQMEADCKAVFNYWQSMREQIAALNSANAIRRAFKER